MSDTAYQVFDQDIPGFHEYPATNKDYIDPLVATTNTRTPAVTGLTVVEWTEADLQADFNMLTWRHTDALNRLFAYNDILQCDVVQDKVILLEAQTYDVYSNHICMAVNQMAIECGVAAKILWKPAVIGARGNSDFYVCESLIPDQARRGCYRGTSHEPMEVKLKSDLFPNIGSLGDGSCDVVSEYRRNTPSVVKVIDELVLHMVNANTRRGASTVYSSTWLCDLVYDSDLHTLTLKVSREQTKERVFEPCCICF